MRVRESRRQAWLPVERKRENGKEQREPRLLAGLCERRVSALSLSLFLVFPPRELSKHQRREMKISVTCSKNDPVRESSPAELLLSLANQSNATDN